MPEHDDSMDSLKAVFDDAVKNGKATWKTPIYTEQDKAIWQTSVLHKFPEPEDISDPGFMEALALI